MASVRLSFASIGVLLVGLAGCGGAAAPVSSTSPASSASNVASAKPAASASVAASSKPAASASAQPAGSSSAKPAGSASAKPTIEPGAPGQTLIAYSEIVGSNVGLWGAKEAGLFKQNGIDVDLRLIESSLSVGALLSNQVQVAAVGGSESLSAAAQGADLKAIATLGPVYPYKFEVGSDIKNKDDLIGKKVGVSRIGSSSDVATRVGLKAYGLDPNKDVSIVQVGSASARTAAMFSGAIQGALVTPPDTVKLEDQGFHPLFDLAAQKLPAANDMLIVKGEWLASHQKEAQAIIDAEIQASAREKQDRAFTEGVMKQYYKVDDPKLLDAAYDYFVGTANPVLPFPKPEQLKDSLASVVKRTPEAKNFDLNSFLDPSLVQSAADRGIGKK